MSETIHIRNLSALKDLDHEVGVDHSDHLSEVWKFYRFPTPTIAAHRQCIPVERLSFFPTQRLNQATTLRDLHR